MFAKFQTYYLLIAAACLLMMYLFPVAQIKTEKEILNYNTNGIIYPKGEKKITHHSAVQIFIPISAFVLLASALIFKKTGWQKSAGRISYILILILLITSWMEINHVTENMLEKNIIKGYRGFYFPIASLAFVFLANRAIKREEEILKIFEKMREKPSDGKIKK